MPIMPFLKDSNFSPDLTRVVKIALEMTRAALQFPNNDDPVITLVAKRIVELAKGGECNPDHLCEQVLHEIRGGRPQKICPEFEEIARSTGAF
jgi:hypothetical protein